MRHVPGWKLRGLMALSLMACLSGPAIAAPLNPLDFPLTGGTGAFPTAPGQYGFNFDKATPVIAGPGGISIPGVIFTDAPGHQIAVFSFASLTIGSDQLVYRCFPIIAPFCGGPPVALLSRGDITINGAIDIGGGGLGGSPYNSDPGPGGWGGGDYGPGSNAGGGPGGGGGTVGGFQYPSGGGGGGFGGPGGGGGGASGGPSYGDLASSLQGGSGGGSGLTGIGGGGGGAIEIGALGAITVAGGGIRANGANAAPSGRFGDLSGGGGGSGGGIFLHGDSVQLLAVVSAMGGSGGGGGSGSPPFCGRPPFGPCGDGGGGGGGGGGRVLIEFGAGGFSGSTDLIDVSGGPGGGGYFPDGSLGNNGAPGSPGVVGLVPEPETYALMLVGLAAVGLAARRRRA